jgi:hypothetical protein
MQKSAFRVAKERERNKEKIPSLFPLPFPFPFPFLFLFVCSKESHKRANFFILFYFKFSFYLGVVPSGL